MPRVGHKKSRKGCLRCKQRRVKCDEKLPCSACVRHAVRCSLYDLSPRIHTEVVSSPARSAEHETTLESDTSPHTLAEAEQSQGPATTQPRQTSTSECSDLPPPANQPRKELQDCIPFRPGTRDTGTNPHDTHQSDVSFPTLELMVHYTTIAYRTFCFSPSSSEKVRSDVPQLALTSTFLMHELLAFSAFHLAYTHPDRRLVYIHQAIWHQEQAIAGQRDALRGPLAPSGRKVIYVTSILVVFCAFAALPSGEIVSPSFEALNKLLDIFPLVHGMGVILHTSDMDANSETLRGLFTTKIEGAASSSCHHCIHEFADRLQILGSRLKSVEDASKAEPLQEETTQLLIASLESLNACALEAADAAGKVAVPAELMAVFLWAVRVPKQFSDLVRRGQPVALLLIAYYAVLISHASSSCWFLVGWSNHLIQAVGERLVGSTWSDLLLWPASVIRRNMAFPQNDSAVF